MQIFACDKNGNHLLASQAIRRVDYDCPECKGLLRLREGSVRRAHFYHTHPTEDCRQSNKSLEHLQVQWRFFDLIPCRLEQRFSEIDRIADVVWEAEKLIFEVQCSPISLSEVRARNRDYESLGYRVIWILHDRRYNQRKVFPVESFPHYYTNIDEEGEGIIYDQFEKLQGNLRKSRFPPLTIDPAAPLPFPKEHPLKAVLVRKKEYPCAFQGDLSCTTDLEYIKRAEHIEATNPQGIKERIFRPFKILEMYMLKKVCR
ncbi:MAG: competence protein CoiA family protein [Waddliaceae bacterium]